MEKVEISSEIEGSAFTAAVGDPGRERSAVAYLQGALERYNAITGALNNRLSRQEQRRFESDGLIKNALTPEERRRLEADGLIGISAPGKPPATPGLFNVGQGRPKCPERIEIEQLKKGRNIRFPGSKYFRIKHIVNHINGPAGRKIYIFHRLGRHHVLVEKVL